MVAPGPLSTSVSYQRSALGGLFVVIFRGTQSRVLQVPKLTEAGTHPTLNPRYAATDLDHLKQSSFPPTAAGSEVPSSCQLLVLKDTPELG